MGLHNDPQRKTLYFVLLFLVAFSVLRCSQALTDSFAANAPANKVSKH